jgi:TolB-like protein
MMLRLVLQALLLFSPMPVSPSPATPGAAFRARTLAVLNFDNNTGRSDYDPMGRGLAAMMITDLSASPELKLVERERMQDVLKEQEMQRSRMFDSTTAVKAGRLLGAEFIATGSLAAATPELRIDMRVIRVETGQIVKVARVTGPEDKIFDLEKELADHVLKDLDIALSPESEALLRKRQEANRELGVGSFKALSSGLAAMDGGDYLTAAERFQPLVMKSPGSMLVELAYGEAKRRAALAAQQSAKQKVGDALKGLFKKPD